MFDAQNVSDEKVQTLKIIVTDLRKSRHHSHLKVAQGSNERAKWAVHQGVRPMLAVRVVLLLGAKQQVSFTQDQLDHLTQDEKENIDDTRQGALNFVQDVTEQV